MTVLGPTLAENRPKTKKNQNTYFNVEKPSDRPSVGPGRAQPPLNRKGTTSSPCWIGESSGWALSTGDPIDGQPLALSGPL